MARVTTRVMQRNALRDYANVCIRTRRAGGLHTYKPRCYFRMELLNLYNTRVLAQFYKPYSCATNALTQLNTLAECSEIVECIYYGATKYKRNLKFHIIPRDARLGFPII